MKCVNLLKTINISILFILLLCVEYAVSVVPATINYQGRLRQSGLPVTGLQTMRFKLYDALTDGTKIWDSGDVNNISVSTGIFSYKIGSQSAGGYNFSTIDWTAGPYYLETTIGATVLSPREQLSSSVYSFYAASAAYAANASVNGLTASRALVSNASGVLTVSNVTSTELDYVSGVTSAIQTQLNTKAPTASPTFTGTVTMPGTGIWNSSGNVGIGTTNPNTKLVVNGGILASSMTLTYTGNSYSLEVASGIKANGRVKDKTGFITPVGTILSYAGAAAPEGWLSCNGAAVSRTTYADLFAVVATSFGNGNGSTTFNVPDLRGVFLRGWDSIGGSSANRDPDKTGRTALLSGGSTGDNVGSYQTDAFKIHRHNLKGGTYDNDFLAGHPTYTSGLMYDGDGPGVLYDTVIGSSGGNETRTKNVNVNYIIKY